MAGGDHMTQKQITGKIRNCTYIIDEKAEEKQKPVLVVENGQIHGKIPDYVKSHQKSQKP